MKPQFLTIILALSFSSIVAHAETYTWKDKNGKTHFGDQVPPEYKKAATLVDLPPLNTAKPEEAVRIQNQAAADRLKRQDNLERARQKQQAQNRTTNPVSEVKLTKEQCRDMKLRTVKQKTACFREADRQSGSDLK